ncbi:hypothetical protein D3C74_240630 [compost metagenome]
MSGHHPADRFRQAIAGLVLEQITLNAGLDSSLEVTRPGKRRQNDHAARRSLRLQLLGNLESAHQRHFDVHQADIRAQGLDKRQRPGPVSGLADDLKVVLQIEQRG